MDREIAILEHQELQIEKVEVEIQKLAYAEGNIRLLMTIPCIDYNTASALLAVFGDISRFKDADHAASYLGSFRESNSRLMLVIMVLLPKRDQHWQG